MKSQHTVKNGLSGLSQEVSNHLLSHSVSSRIMYMQAKVKRKFWNLMKLSSTLLNPHFLSSPAELLSVLISVSIKLLQTCVPACVYFCTRGEKNSEAQSWGACFCASHTLLTHFDKENYKKKENEFSARGNSTFKTLIQTNQTSEFENL